MSRRTPAIVFCALIASGLLVTPATAQMIPISHLLSVDVPSVAVSGNFLLDGAPTSASAGEFAVISLVATNGETIGLGVTNEQSYGPWNVIPGTYDASYDFAFSSGDLPINATTPIATGLTVDGSAAVDLNVPTVEIEFTLLLNGAPFPVVPGEIGDFLLRHVESGAEMTIGAGTDSLLLVRVIPGSYDVIYAHRSGTLVPQNEHAVVRAGLSLTRNRSLTIDLVSISHFVVPTLDGVPFPASPLERGEIRFVDFASGDSVSFGSTDNLFGVQPVLAGTYDVTYSRLNGGGFAPINSNAVVAEDIVVEMLPAGQLSFTPFDVPTYQVSRDITIDGSPAPASIIERGDIAFVGAHGDEINFGSTHVASPTYRVIPGTYDVFYRGQIGSTAVPGNPNARIASAIRIDEDEVVAIDIPTVQLSFDFSVDGVAFSASQLERGRFTLAGEESGDTIDLGPTHEAPPSPRVVAGRYSLVYDWEAGSTLVPRNEGFRVVEDALLTTDQTLAADVTTQVVVPTFLLDGGAFPSDAAQAGEIVLRAARGGELSLGTTEATVPDSVIAIEGAYAVDYHWVDGIEVPRNPRATVGFAAVPEPGLWMGLVVGALSLADKQNKLRFRHR